MCVSLEVTICLLIPVAGKRRWSEAWGEVVWYGGVVRLDVVWCGVMWCGVVWCGMVWRGMVWCGVVWRCDAVL